MEFDVIAAIFAVVGAIVSLIVMGSSNIGIFWKLLSFIGTAIACYFIVSYQLNR